MSASLLALPMKHFNCGRKRPDVVIRNTKHGHAVRGKQHPVYKVWHSMRSRCRSKQSPDYENYLLRGIKVCKRWKTFQNFFEDMSAGYKRGLLIERIDNNKGYTPSNCKWATRLEQNRNKRNVEKFSLNGKTATGPERSDKLGGNPALVYVRLRRGWNVTRAITTPPIPPHFHNRA